MESSGIMYRLNGGEGDEGGKGGWMDTRARGAGGRDLCGWQIVHTHTLPGGKNIPYHYSPSGGWQTHPLTGYRVRSILLPQTRVVGGFLIPLI